MFAATWRTTWFTGSLAAAALTLGTTGAQAGWGSSGGSWGGSSGGWGGGGWGSSGGSWGGSHGGHFRRAGGWRGHHGSWGGWGSSGGGWGSSGGWGRYAGSHGGSWGGGGWGSSGGYAQSHYGSHGGSAGAAGMTYYGPAETRVERSPSEPTPADPPADKPSDVPPPTLDNKAIPGPSDDKKASIDSTILTVSVPDDAKVFVNGKETATPGSERQYISRHLVPGYRYSYRIRAEVIRDGEPVVETKIVEVQSGETARVDFDLATAVAKKKPATKLTVHVPEDTRLFLAGRETRSTGATRTFSTGMIEGENAWENYTIRAVAMLDGRTVTKEKTITLHAGQHQEVTFDFDTAAPTLAAATGEAVR